MKKITAVLCAIAIAVTCFGASLTASAEFTGEYHNTEVKQISGMLGDVPVRFVCTNVTEKALEDKSVIKAEYTVERSGQKLNGTVDINRAYSSIVLDSITVKSEDFTNGREGDYVVGILFKNVEASDVITVTFDGKLLTYAAQEEGVGNTTLAGIEIKDQNGDGVIHIGCIGDSITAGNPGKCYPDYLQEYLNELSKIDGNTYVVHNNGKGGAGVGNTEEQIGDPNWGWSTVEDEDGDGYAYFYYDDIAYKSAFDYVHDVTIVQMGTNNWADSNLENHFADDYYNWLIKPFQDMGSQVIISTAPYAYEDLYKESINGRVHNEIVKMAWNLNLPIIDMNRLTFGMDEIYDGIHPFPSGYSVMALLFYEYIFGGDASTVSVTAQPGSKVTFVDSQGRSYNRNIPASGKVDMLLSPEEREYNVSVECNGYLTYRETLTVSGDMSFTPTQQAATNIALGCTAFDNGVEVYGGTNVAANIIDGELTSGGWQPNSYKSGDYVGIEFAKANVFTMNIYWETASYISSFDKNGYEIWFKVNGTWEKRTASELSVSRTGYTGDIICDVVTVDPAEEIEGVRIVLLDGEISDHKFAPKLYELEVFA